LQGANDDAIRRGLIHFKPRLFLFCLLLFVAFGGLAARAADTLETMGRPVDREAFAGPEVRFKIQLAGAKNNVKLVELKSGEMVYIVKRLGSNTDRMLTPEEFSSLYYRQQTDSGWVATIFNITSPVGIIWVAIGFLGQILFTGRMLVQWFASEKNRKSVVPVAFWWMSLTGATMLLIYFIWRRDIVGIMGQATGWFIYVRNLVLIRRHGE